MSLNLSDYNIEVKVKFEDSYFWADFNNSFDVAFDVSIGRNKNNISYVIINVLAIGMSRGEDYLSIGPKDEELLNFIDLHKIHDCFKSYFKVNRMRLEDKDGAWKGIYANNRTLIAVGDKILTSKEHLDFGDFYIGE